MTNEPVQRYMSGRKSGASADRPRHEGMAPVTPAESGRRLDGDSGEHRVSVVICAYTEKRWEDIQLAIKSLVEQARPAHEVILVIDHNDALLDRATREFSWVRVIASTGPQGLSGARNTGVAAATGDIVAFLDDDARAHVDWLAKLIAPYDDPAVYGVGGAVSPLWPVVRPRWFPAEFDWVVGCSYVGLPTQLATIRNPIGAAMSVRKAAFDTVGGFTDGIGRVGTRPLGCEETEFYIRVRTHIHGAIVLYNPEAVIDHRVTSQRASWRYFIDRCYAEGLSKAVVARHVGQDSALESERAYVRHVLPQAAWQALRTRAWSRAAALFCGLMVTSFGYARGTVAILRGQASFGA